MKQSRGFLGIAVVLAIAVCFALANTLASLAYAGGSDPLSLSTSRFFLPALILLLLLPARGVKILLPQRDGLIAITLGIVTAIYTFALLSAINLMPVSLAVLIFFLFPLFTSIILAICGWERLTLVTGGAAMVAFLGLALALGVHSRHVPVEGIVYAALAALGLAIVSAVSSRVIRSGDSRPVTLYMAASAAIVFALVSLLRGQFLLPHTMEGWIGFVGSNLFYAGAMIGFFIAISLIGPAKTTLFGNVEPLITLGTAYLFLGQLLAPQQIAGVALVVLALVGASILGRRQQPNQSKRR